MMRAIIGPSWNVHKVNASVYEIREDGTSVLICTLMGRDAGQNAFNICQWRETLRGIILLITRG
jgi:hypothetical protein